MANIQIFIDSTLGQQLKTYRTNHNIKASTIADYIKKSPAYISKLEKGEIKSISKDLLVRIVNYISNSDNGYNDFIDVMSKNLNVESLEKSNFILNFDWTERQIPIPKEFCKYIKNKMQTLNISIDSLKDYINENEDLDSDFFEEHHIDRNLVDPNLFHIYREADSQKIGRNYIIIQISSDKINDIINERIQNTSYLFLYAIIYHILKYEEKNKKIILDESSKEKIKTLTSKKLQEYKIYTLSEKRTALLKASEELSPDTFLSVHDIKNREEIINLCKTLQVYSEINLEYTNQKLEGINKNLSELSSFALAYMAMALSPLVDIPSSQKKDFLNAIQKLIEEYSSNLDGTFEKF